MHQCRHNKYLTYLPDLSTCPFKSPVQQQNNKKVELIIYYRARVLVGG